MRVFFSTQVNPPSAPEPLPFAVDAPDGTSEDCLVVERSQVDMIVEHAARYEDPDYVNKLHEQQQEAAKIFAVDAPDGESEDIHLEDLHAVEEVIDYAAEHEDKEAVIRGHEIENEVKEILMKRSTW
jgi:hypothetical protein